MAKREFLQLAHKYKDQYVGGWFVSEKLDGMRAFWDGGITRGMAKKDVPWANILKDKREHRSTGLWSRYGNCLQAPDWWLDQLPPVLLDGELFNNDYSPGGRQSLMSTVKRLEPDQRWSDVKFYVFDSPKCISDGRIDNVNMQVNIQGSNEFQCESIGSAMFRNTYSNLCELRNNVVIPHEQLELPNTDYDLDSMMDIVLSKGGEGLIVRHPHKIWTPQRSHFMLKMKPRLDSEGVVVGYRSGKGKHRGRMGALILQWQGKIFEIGGFTDNERMMNDHTWCRENTGEECPKSVFNITFQIGTNVTFKYRTLSRDGIPQEAAYWRKA